MHGDLAGAECTKGGDHGRSVSSCRARCRNLLVSRPRAGDASLRRVPSVPDDLDPGVRLAGDAAPGVALCRLLSVRHGAVRLVVRLHGARRHRGVRSAARDRRVGAGWRRPGVGHHAHRPGPADDPVHHLDRPHLLGQRVDAAGARAGGLGDLPRVRARDAAVLAVGDGRVRVRVLDLPEPAHAGAPESGADLLPAPGRLPGAAADPARHRAVGVRAAAGDRYRRAVHRVDGARRHHGDVRRDRADRRVRVRWPRPPRSDRAHDVADRAFLRAGRAAARADPRLRVPTSAARCLPRSDAELHRCLEHRGPAAHRAFRRGDVLLPVQDVPQPAAGRHRLHRARTAARGRAVRDPAPEGARDLAARRFLRTDHRACAGPDDLRGRRARP